MHETRGQSRRNAGFTLIELLVVISIIALLIAILLPALKAARIAATAVTCQSNMRQLAIATEAYKTDHAGDYPATRVSLSNRFFNQLAPYLGVPEAQTYTTFTDPDYLRLAKYFLCPGEGGYSLNSERVGTTLTLGFHHNIQEKAYRWNERDLFNLDGQPPSYWVMYFDTGVQGPFSTSYRYYQSNHGNGSNLVMADGHLEVWPVTIPDATHPDFATPGTAYTWWVDNGHIDLLVRFWGPGAYTP